LHTTGSGANFAVISVKELHFDPYPESRGMWVKSKHAYYKLGLPSDTTLPNSSISQSSVAKKCRAVFSLFCDCVDAIEVLGEEHGIDGAALTINGIKSVLTKKGLGSMHDLDLELMKLHPDLLLPHLKIYGIKSSSAFYKAIANMSKEKRELEKMAKKDGKAVEIHFDYLESAMASEKRRGVNELGEVAGEEKAGVGEGKGGGTKDKREKQQEKQQQEKVKKGKREKREKKPASVFATIPLPAPTPSPSKPKSNPKSKSTSPPKPSPSKSKSSPSKSPKSKILPPTQLYKVGDLLEANWKGRGDFYACRVVQWQAGSNSRGGLTDVIYLEGERKRTKSSSKQNKNTQLNPRADGTTEKSVLECNLRVGEGFVLADEVACDDERARWKGRKDAILARDKFLKER